MAVRGGALGEVDPRAAAEDDHSGHPPEMCFGAMAHASDSLRIGWAGAVEQRVDCGCDVGRAFEQPPLAPQHPGERVVLGGSVGGMAELRGATPEEIASITSRNFDHLCQPTAVSDKS